MTATLTRRRWFRFLLVPAALFVALLGAAGFAVFWFQCGPGLAKEADRLASVVELRPGLTVADIGAGRGRIAVRLARRLGPSGRLYATELGAAKLETLRRAAAGLANVSVLAASEHSTGLPDACCDVIYMRRVYHHLTDPAAVSKGLYAALRPGGRLAVIDMLSPRWIFFLHHGIPPDVPLGQLSAAGLVLDRRIDGWSPIDYCLVFRRPPEP
ncbi:MAG: methyltransferase domain-containing protein [Acidobacteriota bacterium]